MRAIVEIDPNPKEGHTMTVMKLKAVGARLEALVSQDREPLKPVNYTDLTHKNSDTSARRNI